MEINLGVGLLVIPFVLIMFMLPVALLVALQVWMCKKSVRLGLILPGISLALSLLLTLAIGLGVGVFSRGGNTLVVQDETTGQIIEQSYESDWQFEPAALLPAGLVFLVTNIPTVVFGGIWLHYKGRKDTADDLKRMKIEDLE